MPVTSTRPWRSRAARLWGALLLFALWSHLCAGPVGHAPAADAPRRPGGVAVAPADAGAEPRRRLDPLDELLRRARGRDRSGQVVIAALPPPPAPAPAEPPGAAAEEPAPGRDVALNVVPPLTPAIDLGGTGVLRRPEPIEPPVLDDDAWHELLVAVEINGAPVSEGAVVAQGPDGRMAARVQDLRGWRLRLDQDRMFLLNGEPFYPLDALPGAALQYDPRTLTLRLSVAADGFEATVVDASRPPALPPGRGVGGFLDYDAVVVAGGHAPTRVDGLLEVGVFNGIGVLLSNLRARDLSRSGREVARLETTLIRDLPERRATLRLGDAFTGSGALGRPVRFGGIQYATDFATDPAFITYPVPTIGGLAEQNSVVEVFINNARRATEDVPAGPFELQGLPVVTGAGEVQLRVTDLLGRERIVTQPYYVSPRLLKPGLSAFSYEVGVERDGFGDDSFNYGQALVAGTHRYGLTDALSGELRTELQPDRQLLGVGATGALPGLGLLSGGLAGSRSGDEGTGLQASLEYEFVHPRFRVGARTRYSAEDFRQLGLDGPDPPPRRVDQLNLGLSLGDLGRLGLFLVHSDARAGQDRLTLSGSYGLRLGPGSLLVNAVRTFEPGPDLALTASYALPLAPGHSLSTSTSVDRDRNRRHRVQASGGRGATDLGLRYRVGAEVDRGSPGVDGTLAYDAAAASLRVDFDRREDFSAVRGGVSGSVAALDGHVGPSRRIGRAFGLVSVPGFAGVPVYVENREVGRTDEDGNLLLPDLNPYLPNRVRIDPTALPLDAELGAAETVAVPYARSGVTIPFAVERQRTALATLVDALGEPLPAGLELAGADGRMTARVARAGLAYIRGVADDPVVLTGAARGRSYRCALPHPLPDEPQAQLGEIRCEP